MATARQVITLAVAVGICLGAAGIGSVLTRPSIATWYATLRKPRWTPPNWVFGPVPVPVRHRRKSPRSRGQ